VSVAEQLSFDYGAPAVPCSPAVKWPGSKRDLGDEIASLLPPKFCRYFEPFCGGAALFFALQPGRSTLSDANADLIDMYGALRNDLAGVIAELRTMRYASEEYYAARAEFNERSASLARRAALFIYLSKTGFNGLFRVNRSGKHNVPFGRYTNPTICDVDRLTACSAALQRADLHVASFESVLEWAKPGDLVYLDPPYVPASDTSSFVAYTAAGFQDAMHARVADVFRELASRCVYVVASNSDTERTRELYRGFRTVETARGGGMNCDPTKRGKVGELIICGW
jgi:DNA adenine methylase